MYFVPIKGCNKGIQALSSLLKPNCLLQLVDMNTGSRLQRVRLLWASSYNQQLFLSERNTSAWHQCLKSVDIMSTAYNEQIFTHHKGR